MRNSIFFIINVILYNFFAIGLVPSFSTILSNYALTERIVMKRCANFNDILRTKYFRGDLHFIILLEDKYYIDNVKLDEVKGIFNVTRGDNIFTLYSTSTSNVDFFLYENVENNVWRKTTYKYIQCNDLISTKDANGDQIDGLASDELQFESQKDEVKNKFKTISFPISILIFTNKNKLKSPLESIGASVNQASASYKLESIDPNLNENSHGRNSSTNYDKPNVHKRGENSQIKPDSDSLSVLDNLRVTVNPSYEETVRDTSIPENSHRTNSLTHPNIHTFHIVPRSSMDYTTLSSRKTSHSHDYTQTTIAGNTVARGHSPDEQSRDYSHINRGISTGARGHQYEPVNLDDTQNKMQTASFKKDFSVQNPLDKSDSRITDFLNRSVTLLQLATRTPGIINFVVFLSTEDDVPLQSQKVSRGSEFSTLYNDIIKDENKKVIIIRTENTFYALVKFKRIESSQTFLQLFKFEDGIWILPISDNVSILDSIVKVNENGKRQSLISFRNDQNEVNFKIYINQIKSVYY